VYGSSSIDSNAYYKLNGNASNLYVYNSENGEYSRKQSALEWIVDLNVRAPIVLYILYFAIFWHVKSASPGQIAGHSAVIMADGRPPALVEALKRATIFVFTLIPFGIGGLAIFIGDKQTLWDKFCSSRVVE